MISVSYEHFHAMKPHHRHCIVQNNQTGAVAPERSGMVSVTGMHWRLWYHIRQATAWDPNMRKQSNCLPTVTSSSLSSSSPLAPSRQSPLAALFAASSCLAPSQNARQNARDTALRPRCLIRLRKGADRRRRISLVWRVCCIP